MISIFARPAYYGNRFHGMKEESLLRASSRIRGEEIANYLGAKLNPKSGFEGDVCIYVKPYSLNEARDGDWVDFLDGGRFYDMLKQRPKVNIIAAAQNSFDFLTTNFQNKVVLIPQHHINFDRIQSNRNDRPVAGYIGAPSPEAVKICKNLKEEMEKLGFDFKYCLDFKTREDSVNFYKSINLLTIGIFEPDYNPHKIPTKIINAASYGVPTIAFPLAGYKEIEGYYVRANDMYELVYEAKRFLDPGYLTDLSGLVVGMAEKYHISNIAKLYRSL